MDEKNRTTGALDFNAQYGKLNAKAINNDDKIYLTLIRGMRTDTLKRSSMC